MKINNLELTDTELELYLVSLTKEWFQRKSGLGYGRVILYDGTVVSLVDFKPEDFKEEHCFNVLPNINRYNGNTYIPFSDGQHSILCLKLAKLLFPEDRDAQFCCLIHDFPEGITGDCISPIKHLFPMLPFRILEENVEKGMLSALGISDIWDRCAEKVHLVDKIALSLEVQALNKYYFLDIWDKYIFSSSEMKNIFRSYFAEYQKDIVESVLNLTSRQVEVKLRNSFNSLYKEVKT